VNVVGVDLSLTATGIATAAGLHLLSTDRRGEDRIDWIADQLVSYYAAPGDTDLVVLEGLSHGSQGNKVHEIAGLHWHVRAILFRFAIPTAVVPPSTLKKYTTGKGTATKPDMRMALYQRTGLDERDDNKVDAWWLRAMGADALGVPTIGMPAAHRAALAKVKWPEGVGARV
jgi:hypothetical protein